MCVRQDWIECFLFVIFFFHTTEGASTWHTSLYKRKSNKSLLLYENMVKFCRRTNILQQYSRHFPTGFGTHCSINIQLLPIFIFYSVGSIHTKLSNKGTFFSFHISSLPFCFQYGYTLYRIRISLNVYNLIMKEEGISLLKMRMKF